MSVIEQRPVRTGAPSPAGLTWWQAGLVGVAAAAVANLVVYATARAAGVSFEVVDGDTTETVTAAIVLMFTIVPMAVGFAVAVLVSLRWLWALRVAAAVGAVLALATIGLPFTVDADGGTQAALAVMHVSVAGGIVLAFETYRRRRVAPSRTA